MLNNYNGIIPTWPAPLSVKAFTTVRQGGFSVEPYHSLNLALHVEDDVPTVQKNRQLLKSQAHFPAEPLWLQQVHGTTVVDVNDSNTRIAIEADASVAFKPNQVCVVLTADCLPILLCDKAGTRVSAIHAGWRGMSAGIIERAVERLQCEPENLLAWVGPAIGPKVFEVGSDVLAAFNYKETDLTEDSPFIPKGNGKWLGNLYQLATLRLQGLGVKHVFGGDYCTYTDTARFFSARRSRKTGRMASFIWIRPT